MKYLQFKDKHGNEVQLGDFCRFFWNPILNEDSCIFEYELPIEYLPEFAAFGFRLVSKKGEVCNVSLWALSEFSEFGFEKINNN
ncbi:hypothetical protein D1Z97_03160 [Riemerella anatipestifer]|uniref:hypothetical protein n=1 Tax=Riemerella anatipestifer TaxID=34085 RepID=UPI00129D74F0|nr:hypothetical protein [Riemerella anatipestifer]MRN00206.1 hypothetical protein [Riemerella anatipestifer]MRN02090.1 hypothetical protein [Riemerella anatipestifer]